MDNLFFNNRFVFQETPPPVPEKNAKETLGGFMPEDTLKAIGKEIVDEPIEKEALNKMSKGYPEIKIKKEHKGIIDMAKKQIKEKTRALDNPHRSSATVFGADGHEYAYIHDSTRKPPGRLFKSEEPVVSVENEYASVNLKEGYREYTGKKAKKITKAVRGLLEGNPPDTIVDLDALVANNLLSGKERKTMKGNILYAIKLKGKIRLFFGYELT